MKIITALTGLLTVAAVASSGSGTIARAGQSEARPIKDAQKVESTEASLGADAHPAPCRSWIDPHSEPKLALLCIHGLGLNSDAYNNFGTRMARHGLATYAIDVRGFGSWMKAKGNEQVNFDQCLGDIQATLVSIRMAHPGLPVFILGESMGGAIVLRACSIYPDLVDGMISSVPAGDRFQQKKTDLKVALEFLKGRHKQFDIGKQIVDQATQNPTLREDWQDDPLDRMDLSAEQLLQFQSFMNDNHEAAKKIKTTPVLVLQGTLDRLVKPEGTWEIFNDLATRHKTFIALPSEHLVLEEGQAKSSQYDAKTDQLVVAWLYGHIGDGNALNSAMPATENQANDKGTTASLPAANSVNAATSKNRALPAVASAQGGARGEPTVLVFEDSWSAQCQGLDQSIAQAEKLSGAVVKVKTVNVSDPANTSLLANYKIAPIPTCVFLKSDGSVGSIVIGQCSVENLAEGMRAISSTPAAPNTKMDTQADAKPGAK